MKSLSTIRCLNCGYTDKPNEKGHCKNCNARNWGYTELPKEEKFAIPGNEFNPMLLYRSFSVIKKIVIYETDIIIGRKSRSSNAAVQFDDSYVSKIHAVIKKSDIVSIYDGIDKPSTNGIYINGEKMKSKSRNLVNKDVIQIGRQFIVYLDQKLNDYDCFFEDQFSLVKKIKF